MNKVEDNNEKYREVYRGFELSMVKDIEDSLQELRLRPTNVETKDAYEQRMYNNQLLKSSYPACKPRSDRMIFS